MSTTSSKTDFLREIHALVDGFAKTAIERDKEGGTAKQERDRIRRSGLLLLSIPKQFGGYGGNWITVLNTVEELAKVDGSLAHLFGYHHLCVASTHLFGSSKQKEHFYKETAENNFFWGNCFNPLDHRLLLQYSDGKMLLDGRKSFCSGAKDSDLLLISATEEQTKKAVFAVIPTNRKGVKILDDWDNIGQRQTDSGTVVFERVPLYEEDILDYGKHADKAFPTLRTLIAQTILTHVLLGIAEGSFEEAKQYTRENTRAWLTSNVKSKLDDPYIIHHYGEISTLLSAAKAISEKASLLVQQSWEKEWNLTSEERGETAVAVSQAKIFVSKIALDITNRIFEVMGARATSGKYRFDRFWRNVRTHTLHDPVDYRIRDVGNWALNHVFPIVSPYS